MTKAYLKPNLILLYPYLTPLTTLDLLEGFKENGGTYVRTYVLTYVRTYKYSDDNTPSGVNSAG